MVEEGAWKVVEGAWKVHGGCLEGGIGCLEGGGRWRRVVEGGGRLRKVPGRWWSVTKTRCEDEDTLCVSSYATQAPYLSRAP